MPHDPACQCCTYTLNSAGTQIAFHSHGIFRHLLCQPHCLKLFAVYGMLYKVSLCLDRCSLRNDRKCTDTGQFILIFYAFQHHHCISIVFVPENDMINISGHTFTHTCLFLPVFFRNFSSNHNTAKSQNIYDTLHKYSWLLSNAGQASILFIISAYIPVPTATTCIES